MDYSTIITSIITAFLVSVIGWLITIARYQEKVNALEKKTDTMEKGLQEVRDKVIACETRIDERGHKGLAKNKSPIDLTEKGLDLLRASGGQEWIITNRPELLKAIKAKNPTSAYDVQEYSKEVLKDIVAKNDPRLKPLKDYAYAKGISLDDIIFVMSIQLRNEVMPEFKGYNVADIHDEDNPT
jgi:hypothetical protein